MEDKYKGAITNDQVNVSQSLNSEPAFQQVIDRVRNYITGYNSDGLPRFGILSITAKRTPFFAYDHSSLLKLADTAFTDFHHCFFANSFTKELLLMDKRAKDENRIEKNLLFVALHELSHIVRMHDYRMQQFSPQLANIAGDIRINMDLLKFDDMYISEELAKFSWGCSEEERLRWDGESEEIIAYQILADAKKQAQDNKNNQQSSGQPQQGQGQGKGQGQSKDKSEKIQDLIDALKNGQTIDVVNDDKNVSSDENHMISVKDLIKACEDAGLTNVLDKLQLPSSTNKAKLDELHSKAKSGVINDSSELNMIRNESFNGDRMPGAHINSAVSELITELSQPKISWKTAVREIIQGDGLEYLYSDDAQHDLCYVAPADMGIPDELYLGVAIPHTPSKGTLINIMDTSGSVSYAELKDYCSEIFGQMDTIHEEDGASEVIFMSADTVQRGEIITLTKENYEEYIHQIQIFGRGGTEFSKPLRSAFQWAEENEKKIDGIVYWTDLGACPPKRSDLPETIPPIIFMTHSSHYSSQFKDAVSDFADVYSIDEDLLLDFEKLSEDIPEAVLDYSPNTP